MLEVYTQFATLHSWKYESLVHMCYAIVEYVYEYIISWVHSVVSNKTYWNYGIGKNYQVIHSFKVKKREQSYQDGQIHWQNWIV